ncbi:hypothetical protein [Candidatus Nitrospira salsa]|nr:MAG: hypothetical protein NPIRA01_30700 [Nitrospirales bacterium]
MAIDNQLTISSSTIDVLTQNPGLNLTLGDAANFTLEGGCIRLMRYEENSEDLNYILFDNGNSLRSSQTPGLKDFRQSFECAAKHGMAVTYCISTDRKKIRMVNLYPCLCSCGSKEGKGNGRRANEILGLSGS